MGKLFGLLSLIIVLAIGGYWYTSHAPATKQSVENGETAIDKAKDVKEMVENKGVVSSLRDAMGLGTTMHCTYALDGMNATTEAWINGEKIRTTTITDKMTTNSLSLDGTQYMWTSTSKQGMKLEKACLEKMKSLVPQTDTPADTTTPKDIKGTFDMAKNVKCELADNADFELPKDITFADQCAMMESSMKMMEQYKDRMPAGMKLPQ